VTGTLPPSWNQADAFPSMQFFEVEDCQLTGTLPAYWSPSLQFLDVAGNDLNGTLPAELGSLMQLQQLTLNANPFTGQLPAAWGAPGTFPELFALECYDTNIAGSLPDAWGSIQAFQELRILYLHSNNIAGALPDVWAQKGSFPSLLGLAIRNTLLTGTMPVSWSSADAFPQLQVLDLANTQLHGTLPSFSNSGLSVIAMENCSFDSNLGPLWASSAPLQLISLTNNSLSGSLPDIASALSQLQFLNLANNRLEGTVPLSWLQEGSLLSHISVLNVGQVWDASLAQTNWRQELCLKKYLYDADVTGQQLALLPTLVQHLSSVADYTDIAGVYNDGLYSWLQSSDYLDVEFEDLLQNVNSQLASVPDICANHDSRKVLLVVWIVFAGCCLLALMAYFCARLMTRKPSSVRYAVWPCLLPVWTLACGLYDTFSGLGGLAFYYYDLVTSIIVLTQVWGTWPGGILTAIFLFHFAITGVIVANHGLYRIIKQKYVVSDSGVRLNIAVLVVSLLVGPLCIPAVLVLDTCAFIRDALMCITRFTQLFGVQWARPGYLVAFRIHRSLHAFDYLGFSWVVRENYEDMHNLIAAFLQSMPTVILNSIVFSLGNKPSHGIFLSSGLFVTAIVASCLAMLRCLVVILFQAFRNKVHPARHAASLVVGKTLAGNELASHVVVQSQTRSDSIKRLIQLYHVSGSAPLGDPQQR
jgi:hypothetical protein